MSSFRSASYTSMPSVVPGSRGSVSVYGVAGARGVRASTASNVFGSRSGYTSTSTSGSSYGYGSGSGLDLAAGLGGGAFGGVAGNEKGTMQNLNDRLAAYLEKVRSLEAANAQLDRQIREWNAQQTPSVRDYSKYQAIIDDLRKKINVASMDNARLMLQIDNARLAAEDFRIKFENEMAVRVSVETDIAGLRNILDELTMARSDLEMQVESLKEELVYLKKNHEEELAALRNQVNTRSVNVEVEAKPQDDLASTLEEIRSQYNGITEKSRRQTEEWYNAKFEELNKEVATSTETLQSSRTEINDLKRNLQSLQIELQSQLSLKAGSEGVLAETDLRYSTMLSQHQATVDRLEEELSSMKSDMTRQSEEYKELLDIKTRLELEIAEYRRLLDGDVGKTVQRTEVKVEKSKPVVTQRRKVVVEEIVNGKVVSRTEDMDTEVISK